MISFPNAKINIGLNIVSKRADGYHNLETIFYPIPTIQDILEIVPSTSGSLQWFQTGLPIAGKEENNLVLKAYHLLSQDFNLPLLDIHLHKLIPMGAGLGGGSADAACMLKMLAEYARLPITETKLEEYAATLGADCAFFIKNKPVFASGIGNVFEPIELCLDAYRIEFVHPQIAVSTREAFSTITPKQPKESLKDLITLPIEEWKDRLHNDFEESVFKLYPQIEVIKNQLYQQGAIYASMTGSGSSVYGIFPK